MRYGELSPEAHLRYCENQSRGTGRTTALIMMLPEKKCTIVVASNRHKDTIFDMIRRIRPDYDVRHIRFITYSADVGLNLRGLFTGPIFLDDSVHHAILNRTLQNGTSGK